MSLYRQQRGRSRGLIAAAAVVALIVGAVTGYAIGRNSAPEPSLGERVAEVQEQVQPALHGVSLVPDHYAQSVRGGKVTEPVQYEGATQQVAAAQATLEGAAPDLQILDPDAYDSAVETLQALARAVEAKKSPRRIAELSNKAQAEVSAATGA